MGGVARLARDLGYAVTGSDRNVYPPMSTQLEEAGIELMQGYEVKHLQQTKPGHVIIGNALSRGNPAVEYILNKNIPYSSGPQWLYENLQSRKRQLKPLLLDQTFIAGLGNIYTDESLNIAKLHPLALANTVRPNQAEALHKAIRSVLKEGIRRNGASFDWVYRGGAYQNYFRAYDQQGKPCPTCGTIIEKFTVGQRGTHICPKCQMLERK